MIRLSDYFQPLGFITLIEFTLMFLFFDILGTRICSFIQRNRKENILPRITYWMVGMGFFVFIWFLLGFFILPKSTALLISIGILMLIFVPFYIIKGEWRDLLKAFWNLKLPIIIVLPFLPAVFVKASLPPYYSDEMAYHFIAPVSLAYQLKSFWQFHGGVLMEAPRLMDTFYILIFSLFKTYSIARLFHFVVMISSIFGVYEIFKKNLGILSAFLFTFVFMGMSEGKILTSTLGYVDVATYSFYALAFALVINFFWSENFLSLAFSAIFWGMSLGSKYTPLTSILGLSFVTLILLIRDRQKLTKFFSFKVIILPIVLLLIFGGYWYVKNFVLYGNPIYPFIFHCWGSYSADCPASGFFGSWTTPVTISNLLPIIKELLPKNPVLYLALFVAPFLQIFNKNKKSRLLFILAGSVFVLELIILKFFSGFLVRYQTHLQILLLFIITAICSNLYKNYFVKLFSGILTAVLIISVIIFYGRSIKTANSLGFLNWEEIYYSIGRNDIYHWIDFRFPEMKQTIYWCENPPNGKLTPIARFDPDLIWFDYAGLMRSFITNCFYQNPPLEGIPIENVINVAKNNKMQFWISSINPCIEDNKVTAKHKTETQEMIYLRKLNNKIVCNSKEIKPNLYYFDFNNLK